MVQKLIDRFPAGTVTPPPSKSLSHRAVICAALAARTGGSGTVTNIGKSEDIDATLRGGALLGVRFQTEGMGMAQTVTAVRSETAAAGPVDCGESGSTLRFLLPLAAAVGGRYVFTGRGRLLERPMDELAEALSPHGAELTRTAEGLCLTGELRPGVFALPGDVSSQYVSGLLFALPLLNGDSEITLTSPLESRPYADMTVDVLERFGVEVKRPDGRRFTVRGGQTYAPHPYRVEADYSQAAFWLAAAALGRPVTVAGLPADSLQGDRVMLDFLRQMGAGIEVHEGRISVRAGRLRGIRADVRDCPDLVPVLAVLCALAEGESVLKGAGRLRHKECDRLCAIARELTVLGAEVRETPDALLLRGKQELRGGTVDAHNDHRIAMALAVAAIGCREPVYLTGWEAVRKSYPHFWEDFCREGSA